jgi:hypothetical protein
MKKFLLKIIVYSFLILFLSNSIGFACIYFLGKSDFYKPSFIVNYHQKEQWDYVILGSSTGLTTLNSVELDACLNTNGINASLDDTSLNSHSAMLQLMLETKKKFNTLILCVTPWDLKNTHKSLNDNDYRFITQNNTYSIKSYFEAYDDSKLGLLRNSDWLPFLGVSYFNKELIIPSIIAMLYPDKRNRFDEKGNYTYPNNSNFIKDFEYSHEEATIKNSVFFDIHQFCIKNNIRLVVYQSPIYNKSINYVNLPKNVTLVSHSGNVSKSYFYDNIHVNSNGRKHFTHKFCQDYKLIK